MEKSRKSSKLINNAHKIVENDPISVGKVRKVGRPTKFSPDIPRLTDEYVNECIDTNYIPTLEGLACEFGVVGDTIQEWKSDDNVKLKKSHRAFSASVKRLLQKQSEMLQQHGLSGRYNTAMSIFLLKNNHKFVDKHEVTHVPDEERIDGITYLKPKGAKDASTESEADD